jgi:PKD repeat protein
LLSYISGDQVVTRRVHIADVLMIVLVLSLIWSLDALPFVQAQDSPVADAGGTYSGFEGEAILFDGSGSYDPDGSIRARAYFWDFGDGTSGTGVRPEHTYTQEGTYTITLTVTDNDGLTDTDTTFAFIDVAPNTPPVIDLIEADATSYLPGDVVEIQCFSHDPETAEANLLGKIWIRHEDADIDIVSDAVMDWSNNRRHYYRWTIPEDAEAGYYDVTCRIIDPQGLEDVMTQAHLFTVTPRPPMADAGGTYSGFEGEAILFDGSGTNDADGWIESYRWDFGDGTSGTGVRPEHTYTQEGTYTITLTVTDNDGLTDTDTTQINVKDSEPTAAFSADPGWGEAPLRVQFTDTSISYDGITQWRWDFGDGKQSTEADVTYTYSVPGTYSVTLTVKEADGDEDSVTYKDFIRVTFGDRGQPLISVTPNPAIGYQNTAHTFQIDIENTDTPAYAPSLFVLSVDAPSDWIAQFSKTELRLAPGTHDASVTLTLSVSETAIAQNYTFNVMVVNQDAPAYQNKVTVTLDVREGRQTPHIEVEPLFQEELNGSTVEYTLTIHNIDPPTFPSTMYRLDYTLPEGWTGMISQSAVTLTANTNTSVILKITSPGSALPGEYSFTVSATNTMDPHYVGTSTGFYTVLQWKDVDFTPPTIDVAVTPGTPTPDYATFNVTSTDNAKGSGIYELRLYCDNILMMTWTHAGNYTYTAGPLTAGTHTFYVEALDYAGNSERNPPRDYQRFNITPTIPWHFLLFATLLVLSLAFVIYHGLLRMK